MLEVLLYHQMKKMTENFDLQQKMIVDQLKMLEQLTEVIKILKERVENLEKHVPLRNTGPYAN